MATDYCEEAALRGAAALRPGTVRADGGRRTRSLVPSAGPSGWPARTTTSRAGATGSGSAWGREGGDSVSVDGANAGRSSRAPSLCYRFFLASTTRGGC